MATVSFTRNLQRHVACPPIEVDAATVGEALRQAFAAYDRLEGYVVDERGTLRKHMMVFVDGAHITDRVSLGDAVAPNADIYVMQALSGG